MGLVASLAHADVSVGDNLDLGARLWGNYSNDMTKNGGHRQGFDLSRAYFYAKYKFDSTWSTYLLLDHDRTQVTAANYSSYVYVRNAYVQGKLWSGDGTLRVGIQPTPFIATVDAVTKTRWLAKSLTDESGSLSSQDAGAQASGTFTEYLKYALLVHNGTESLSRGGTSKDNAVAGTATISAYPLVNSGNFFESLGIHVSHTSIAAGHNTTGYGVTDNKNVSSAALTLETDLVDAAVEYASVKIQSQPVRNSYGTTVNVKFLEKYSVFARYLSGNSSFKSNYGASSYGYTGTVKYVASVGPTYAVIKDRLNTALIYDQKQRNSGNDTIKTISWNWAAQF